MGLTLGGGCPAAGQAPGMATHYRRLVTPSVCFGAPRRRSDAPTAAPVERWLRQQWGHPAGTSRAPYAPQVGHHLWSSGCTGAEGSTSGGGMTDRPYELPTMPRVMPYVAHHAVAATLFGVTVGLWAIGELRQTGCRLDGDRPSLVGPSVARSVVHDQRHDECRSAGDRQRPLTGSCGTPVTPASSWR
jgi:hypothetical protein